MGVDVAKLKCLHCGYEYAAPKGSEMEERTCPRCRSSSVRLLRDEEKGS